jgi:hypothetical protein
MISLAVMACVISYGFARLYTLTLATEWDVPPLLILVFLMITSVRLRAVLHRRLI